MSMYPPLKATFLRKPGSGVLKNKSVQANGQINEKNIYQKKKKQTKKSHSRFVL